MKSKILLFAILLINQISIAQKNQLIDLFNGKDLKDWKISDFPETFSVKDGILVVDGDRAHLFYQGPFNNHDFKNFELRCEIKTNKGANSGVYIHTAYQPTGWPEKGYEIQVNNSHTDWRRSASVYGIVDNPEVYVKDGEWYTMTIRVENNRIITKLNDTIVVDYTQPEKPNREEGNKMRVLSSGTIAIQGHDPKSHIEYRKIQIKLL